MFIRCFPSGPFATNCYLVSDRECGRVAVIDPAPGAAEKVLRVLEDEGLEAERILLTHSHWDHIVDVATLVKQLGIEVWVHGEDAANLRRPGSDRLPMMIPFDGVEPDHCFHDGDVVEVAGIQFEVIHTPGHTPGGVCFYAKDQAVLFSGDTLFCKSIGNLSLPTAEPERMWPSLERLAALPEETRVFPGHGEETTIGAESWLPQARTIFGG